MNQEEQELRFEITLYFKEDIIGEYRRTKDTLFEVLGYFKDREILISTDVFVQIDTAKKAISFWSDRLILPKKPSDYHKALVEAFPELRIQSFWQVLEWTACYTDGIPKE